MFIVQVMLTIRIMLPLNNKYCWKTIKTYGNKRAKTPAPLKAEQAQTAVIKQKRT